jgi:hypothetical protein
VCVVYFDLLLAFRTFIPPTGFVVFCDGPDVIAMAAVVLSRGVLSGHDAFDTDETDPLATDALGAIGHQGSAVDSMAGRSSPLMS